MYSIKDGRIFFLGRYHNLISNYNRNSSDKHCIPTSFKDSTTEKPEHFTALAKSDHADHVKTTGHNINGIILTI